MESSGFDCDLNGLVVGSKYLAELGQRKGKIKVESSVGMALALNALERGWYYVNVT